MRYYPVFLDIAGRPCVVVGGGRVAERKALSLISAGGKVTVISPAFTENLKRAARGKDIKLMRRGYKAGDLLGAYLAVAASASKSVNKRVCNESKGRGILVNVVDSPELCSFIVPSVVERGGLVIAISTSGQAPALAKTIRKELEKIIGPEYEAFLEIISSIRRGLKADGKYGKNEKIIKALAASSIPRWIKSGETDKVSAYLSKLLGRGGRLKKVKGRGRRVLPTGQ